MTYEYEEQQRGADKGISNKKVGAEALSRAFYDNGVEEAETKRLQTMADLVDPRSFYAVMSGIALVDEHAMGDQGDMCVVVDVGAGDSTSLGERFCSTGKIRYVAVDQRSDALRHHQAVGHETVHSPATILNIDSNTADAFNSRFTFGWLKDSQRTTALLEMLRVGKNNMSIVITDYDWSTVKGPKQFLQAVEYVKKIMKSAGFDPEYGSTMSQDIALKVEKLMSVSSDSVAIEESIEDSTFIGPISKALPLLMQTGDSALGFLRQTKNISALHELGDLLQQLQEYTSQNPQEEVTLPNVVTQQIKLLDKKSVLFEATKQDIELGNEWREMCNVERTSPFVEGEDFTQITPSCELLRKAQLVHSQDLVDSARHLHATAYIADGLIGPDATESGMLAEYLDSDEVRRRATYVVSLNDEKKNILAGVRWIDEDDGRLDTLPAVSRIHPDDLARHPFSQPGKRVVEISALSKDFHRETFDEVVACILGLGKVLIDREYDYAIMSLQNTKVEHLRLLFGQDTFVNIEDDGIEHTIGLARVNQEARFVNLYVDLATFMEKVYVHAQSNMYTHSNGRPNIHTQIASTIDSFQN
jgi:ubiquinone/menaquinone biosynthesis C-methylase UbiE